MARNLAMVLRAQFVHRVDQNPEVIGVNIRRYAMTKIKHVTRSGAVTLQRVCDTLTSDLGAFTQGRWIQVSL